MTKIDKSERANIAALVAAGMEPKTAAAIYGASVPRIYQIAKAAREAAPALPPCAASRRSPEAAPLRLPLDRARCCATPFCRGPRQPGRDFCADCLANAMRRNRRANMV